jgi:hypothetical protein
MLKPIEFYLREGVIESTPKASGQYGIIRDKISLQPVMLDFDNSIDSNKYTFVSSPPKIMISHQDTVYYFIQPSEFIDKKFNSSTVPEFIALNVTKPLDLSIPPFIRIITTIDVRGNPCQKKLTGNVATINQIPTNITISGKLSFAINNYGMLTIIDENNISISLWDNLLIDYVTFIPNPNNNIYPILFGVVNKIVPELKWENVQ